MPQHVDRQGRIKHENLTMYIKNRRDSSNIKGCSPLQLLCNLIGNRPQSATFHTATRYAQAVKKDKTDNQTIPQ
jgi:hypothetical protein